MYLPLNFQMPACNLQSVVEGCHKLTCAPRCVVKSIRIQAGDNFGLSRDAVFGVLDLSFGHRQNWVFDYTHLCRGESVSLCLELIKKPLVNSLIQRFPHMNVGQKVNATILGNQALRAGYGKPRRISASAGLLD